MLLTPRTVPRAHRPWRQAHRSSSACSHAPHRRGRPEGLHLKAAPVPGATMGNIPALSHDLSQGTHDCGLRIPSLPLSHHLCPVQAVILSLEPPQQSPYWSTLWPVPSSLTLCSQSSSHYDNTPSIHASMPASYKTNSFATLSHHPHHALPSIPKTYSFWPQASGPLTPLPSNPQLPASLLQATFWDPTNF